MEIINILFYNTMWGVPLPFSQNDLPPGFRVTTDRHELSSVDAVVFHLPDLQWCMDTDEIIKPEGQIWVAWNLECEENYPWIKDEEFRSNFDLWMGYRQNSDILYPYYTSDYEDILINSIEINGRKNRICMFISSTANQSQRLEYLNELTQYTPIDSYGKIFTNKKIEEDCGRKSVLKIMSMYKFAISFENAITEDYVTEKFYNPLLAGAVPIYRGAPNIQDFCPGENCFLDASVVSPRELAEQIEEYCKSEEYYEFFHQWRKEPLIPSFKRKLDKIKVNPFFRLCMEIRRSIRCQYK